MLHTYESGQCASYSIGNRQHNQSENNLRFPHDHPNLLPETRRMLSVILFVLPPLPSPIPERKRTEHELHTANHSIDKIDVADLKGRYHIGRKDVGEVGAEQHEVVRDGDGQGFAV